jgi:hypothetical protein
MLFPESVMRYSVFTQDTVTGERVRVSGPDSASNKVLWFYAIDPRAIMSTDGAVVSFVEPTNDDNPDAAGVPQTAGLFVRVGSGPLRRVGTVGLNNDRPIYVDSTTVIVATGSPSLLPAGVTYGVVRISLRDGSVTLLSTTQNGTALAAAGGSAISRNGTHLVYGDNATHQWWRRNLTTGSVDDVSAALPWPWAYVNAIDNSGDQLTAGQPPISMNFAGGIVVSQGFVRVSVSTGQQWLVGTSPWLGGNPNQRGTWSLITSSAGTAQARLGDVPVPGNGDTDVNVDVVRNVSPLPVAAPVPHVAHLHAVSNDGGSVTISWSPVQGVDHYWLLQKDRSGGTSYVDRGTSTSVTLPFEQAVTNRASVIPQAGSLVGAPTEVYLSPMPDPPIALGVHRAVCRLSVETQWLPWETTTSVEYQMSVDDGPWTTVALSGPAAVRQTFRGDVGHSYDFRVRGINAEQHGAWSEATTSVSVTDSTCVPLQYTPLAPARLMDSRPGMPTIDGIASGNGTLPAGTTQQLQIAGRAGIDPNANAVMLNVTAVDPTGPGYITVFPCGQTRPTASNLNFTTGQIIANTVVAKLGDNGTVCIYTHTTTNLVVDVNGYA